MLTYAFLKGWAIGFIFAALPGPIGILCFQHAVLRGMLFGLSAGLGAALADTLYGAVAGMGVSAVSHILEQQEFLFKVVGAGFLWYLGIKSFRSQPTRYDATVDRAGLLGVCLTTFVLTASNPMTALCFAGVYAGLGICSAEDSMSAVCALSLGILVGSMVWWVILSAGGAYAKKSFATQPAVTTWLNYCSGGMLLLFAVLSTGAILRDLMA